MRYRPLPSVVRFMTLGALALTHGSCARELDPPSRVIHVRFDPDAKVIPMPTDVLRDDVAGKLDVPTDDTDLSDAEREFYQYLNTLDGWSSAMSATVEFSAPIAPTTINADTVQVWKAGGVPARVEGVTSTLAADELKLTVDPPRTGWERGATYFIVVRGGEAGVEGKQGEPVECDAAFYFLRQVQKLDVPEHERAFPGKDRAERQDNARKLEELRLELVPYFEHFARSGLPRAEVASLWKFTVTRRTELAMDKASQRMPLPMNLLLDPETGTVDLPPAKWDTQTVRDAKHRLRELDGFATSSSLLFGFTAPIDPASVTTRTVEFFELPEGAAPKRREITLRVLPDKLNVVIEPVLQPLPEKTRFGVVVRKGLKDAEGQPVIAMPVGHFVRSKAPVHDGQVSLVGAVDEIDARRLERVRKEVRPMIEALPTGDQADVLTAWTFTTMGILPRLEASVGAAEALNLPVAPANIQKKTPGQALAEWPLAITSLLFVGDVYHGTIKSPVYLDKTTRGWREDGGHVVEDIPFTMTVPRNLRADRPVPVVIFGHAIMTERRFVLAMGDALAQRGFAAVAIDLPYHGQRTYCWSEGPLAVPNPQTGELTSMSPCESGATCRPDGRCVDASGQNRLAKWPVIPMYTASGAAFIEIEHIANTRDHFRQAVVDLGALSRSLRKADWKAVIGAPLATDKLHYAGQSLGGIIGATFVPLSPEIKRAVLNVPGADTVDMFNESPFFSGHVEAFFKREGIDRTSYEGERFLNVARWFMDGTDPHSVAHRLTQGRSVMIQMATLDAIIPNKSTQVLSKLSGVPHRDYVAEHAFLVIPIEPAYLRGQSELADFLAEVP